MALLGGSEHGEGRRPVVEAEPTPAACRRILVNDYYGYVLIDGEGTVQWGTGAIEELLGYQSSDIVGHSMADFLAPDSTERALELLAELQREGDGGVPGIWQVRHADGHFVHVEIGAADYLDDPDVSGIALRLRSYEAQRHLGDYLSALASAASLDRLLTPLVSAASCLIQGADVSLAHGWNGTGFASAVTTRLPPALSATVASEGAEPTEPEGAGETSSADELPWSTARRTGERVLLPDLGSLPAAARAAAHLRGIAACWVLPVIGPAEVPPVAVLVLWRHEPGLPLLSHDGAMDQVTQLAAVAFERRNTEALLLRAARYDALTGIPNRMQFFAKLEADSHGPGRHHLAVLYLDLDGFKDVNDTFGHRVGDELLTEVAASLSASVRPGDLVARLGGDEFAVLCADVTEASEVTAIAARLIGSLSRPFIIGGHDVDIGLSVGIALWGPHGTTHDALVDAADRALYEAKRGGRGRWVLA